MEKTSASNKRDRQRPRTAESNTVNKDSNSDSVFASIASAQSNDRDVLSIIRQDDQELAEAKLNARQQAREGVLDSDSESESSAKQQPQPAGRLTTNLLPAENKQHARNKAPARRNTTCPPSHELDDNDDQGLVLPPNNARVAKEHSKNPKSADQYVYSSRDQAVATNLAFRESQQDAQGSISQLIVPGYNNEAEEKEEEKEEERTAATSAATTDGEDRHDWRSDSKPTSLVADSEHSQPGAFRVGTSFAATGAGGGSRSCNSSDDDDDDDWHDDGDGADDAQLWGHTAEEEDNMQQQQPCAEEAFLLDKSEKSAGPEFEDLNLSAHNSSAGSPADRTSTTNNQGDQGGGDILIEATLVTAEPDVEQGNVVVPEPELVKAQPLEETVFTPRQMIKTQSGRLWMSALLVLFVLVVVGISLGLALGLKEDPKKAPKETMAPTMAPTSFVDDVLPNYTQAALGNNSTPQARAYEWFLNDLEFQRNTTGNEQYVPLQRFVLATLYFALNGDQWLGNKGWLDHATAECTWYTTLRLGSICPNQGQRRQLFLPGIPAAKDERQLQAVRPLYTQLSLNQNGLKGRLPPEIALLSNLDVINMHENEISGAIPSELGLLQYVSNIQVFKNSLSGDLPSELSNLPRVKQLNFAFNNLTGTIPSEYGLLHRSLESLSVSNNPIRGVLPSELGLLTTAQKLFFYENPNLTGPLPTFLGQLHKSLAILQLNAANYTGVLPTELGLLTNLEALSLQNNPNLRGPIPSELGALTKLTILDLYNTDLTGAVPPELCGILGNGTLQSLSVDCDKMNCSCAFACDCSKNSSTTLPNGGMNNTNDNGEIVTESPIVFASNYTDNGEFETEPPVDYIVELEQTLGPDEYIDELLPDYDANETINVDIEGTTVVQEPPGEFDELLPEFQQLAYPPPPEEGEQAEEFEEEGEVAWGHAWTGEPYYEVTASPSAAAADELPLPDSGMPPLATAPKQASNIFDRSP